MTGMKPAVQRMARCACSGVVIKIAGEPQLVSVCNCTECQRRTGSVFGVSAFFEKSQLLSITGDTKTFERDSDSGRSLTMNFCPDCGTTLYWELEMLPQNIGVAVGCFADPTFPKPGRAVWCQTKHDWVTFAASLDLYSGASR